MDGSSSMRCPNCSEPVAPDDFQCAACELLLDPDAAQEVTEPSVVRAMLAPAMRRPSTETPAFAPDPEEPVEAPALGDDRSSRPTALFMPLAADLVVPTVIAGLEVAGRLRDLDAYVASFVDGRKSVAALARDTQLREIEVHAVIRSLEARKLVSLRQVSTPRPKSPEPFPVARPPGANRRQTTAPGPTPVVADRFTETPPQLAREPVTAPAVATTPEPRERPAAASSADARKSPSTAPPSRPASPSRRPRPSFVVGTKTAEHMFNLAGVTAPEPKRPTPAPRPRVPLEAPAQRFIPDNEESVVQRAIAHERDGDIEGAIEVLQRGIARVRKPAPLYNKLALILVAQRRDYDRAEELLKQASELEPDNAVYQQNLFKVVALSASHTNPGRKPGGFLARLTRRK